MQIPQIFSKYSQNFQTLVCPAMNKSEHDINLALHPCFKKLSILSCNEENYSEQNVQFHIFDLLFTMPDIHAKYCIFYFVFGIKLTYEKK